MNPKQIIEHIASVYLSGTLNYKELYQATKDYKNLLNNLSGNEHDTEKGREDIFSDKGKAIGPHWAALCLDDIMRTRQFVRGVNKALTEKTSQVTGKLHVLYAGTGPFATLLMPLISRFPKEKVRYTFMEINPLSFQILQKVVSASGLADYDIKFILEDATQYKIEKNDIPDIIISETMQSALANEQQVTIFLNLMRQANRETIFIPEKIELFIGLRKAISTTTEGIPENYYHKVRKVFEVSKEAMANLIWQDNEITGGPAFSEEQTTIEKDALEEFRQLMILTEIQVYKDERISVNESSLTLPKRIAELSDIQNAITINSRYKISAKPKLEYEIV